MMRFNCYCIFAAVATLVAFSADGRATNDFNPTTGAPVGGWGGVMAQNKFGLKAGKVTAIPVKLIVVDTNLDATHCMTKANTKLAHVHGFATE